MRKKLILTVSAALLMVTTMMAIPAKPGTKKTITLDDGTTIELTLKGDEHYSYYTDAEGTPCQVIKGKLVKMTKEEISKQWTAMKQERMGKAVTLQKTMAARRAGKPINTTTGTHHGLVILMQFKDKAFATENPNATYQRFFNEENYREYGMTGSVRDYFKAQSYGNLTIDFDVVGPYTTKQNMEYYGRPYIDSREIYHNDSHPVEMIVEGIDAAHNDGVDFSKYDWDGDGEVDQVFVIYAGYAEAQGADENTIWPHEWVLAGENKTRKYNGVTLNTYGCASELAGKTGTTLDGIGSACHEFSHCLGLPDMYDTSTNGTNYGTSDWDIMCSGNYNDDSRTPAGYTSYERWFSGWMEPVELKEMTRITDMAPLVEKPEAYILYNEKYKDEYYLLENRQPVGFDAGLPGHGLLVLHVDYNEAAWTMNSVNSAEGYERMTIIPADNDKYNSSSSLAGDPYPGVRENSTLTNYSTPAASLNRENVDGSKLMSKPIDNITENITARTMSFVACRPELAVPTPSEAQELSSDNGFSISWPAVAGSLGYEVELTTIDKAASTPEEALRFESDLSGCYSKSVGFTDISSKLSDYGLKGWTGSKVFTTPNKLRFGTSTATGRLTTPTWEVPASQDITVVMGADKVNSTIDGILKITYGNSGDLITDCPTQSIDFTVSDNAKQVFTFKDVRKQLYWLDILPNAQMYLNYLAIYDGEWTAEQLGINLAATSARRASTVNIYKTETNSYTFKDIDTSKRYAFRVRAIGEENTYSQWSDEKTFEFSSTGIQSIASETQDSNAPVRYFDLQGREVGKDARGLVIMKQGNVVKKVMK